MSTHADIATEPRNYRLWLAELFEEKRRNNPAFSLRAFARVLGISPASLSQVLSGKRRLSRKFALKIAGKLALSPVETRELLKSHLRERYEELPGAAATESQLLELDRFNLIADWYHFAILSLSELKGASAKPEWIARRLNITRAQATEALRRLRQLGLIKVRGDRFQYVTPPLDTPTGTPSSALRKHQSQILHKADLALYEVPMAEREFGTMTLAINPSRLGLAQKRLRAVRDELSELLETGKKERVYIFSYQLFPLDREEKDLH